MKKAIIEDIHAVLKWYYENAVVNTDEGTYYRIRCQHVLDAYASNSAGPINTTKVHRYVPDAMAQGDCRVCGHVEDSPLHIKPKNYFKDGC